MPCQSNYQGVPSRLQLFQLPIRGLSKYLEIFGSTLLRQLTTTTTTNITIWSSTGSPTLASASADPGIEPDVPTTAEIVIDSNMVNFHGEDENTFLPSAVMTQVADCKRQVCTEAAGDLQLSTYQRCH